MGRHIVKQPDGLYAVWSTYIDNFIAIDHTADQVTEFMGELAAQQARQEAQMALRNLNDSTTQPVRRMLTWQKALDRYNHTHGTPFTREQWRKGS